MIWLFATATVFTTQLPAPNDYYIDPSPIEVGMRFRSDVAGQATGIRFYKVPGNTGTHVGHLWTNTGTLLRTVTFTGETASGWQTAPFAVPLTLQANTTYVVSYKSTRGYAVTRFTFSSAGVDNPPLHAPQSAPGALNGVYAYGTAPAVFPSQSTRASNYWVDVVFNYATGPPPNPVPAIASISPSSRTAGSGAFTLQVFGSGFVSTSTVLWNGASRPTTFISGAALSAQIFAGDVASTGTALVGVFNPGPGGGSSNVLAVPIVQPRPVVADIRPRSARAGGPDLTLTVLGSGFTSASTVLWNGQARLTTFIGTGTLSALLFAADTASTGTSRVEVASPQPGGGLSNARAFSVSTGTVRVWAYYTSWNAAHYPVSQVDFGAFDGLIHFPLEPNADGTLNTTAHGMSAAQAAEVVAAAHAAGKDVLFSIGGWDTQAAFQGAMSPANRAAFVENLVGYMLAHGYDGIDVDMEPMGPTDAAPYDAFIRALRARMDQVRPGAWLTAAAGAWVPETFAQLSGVFDHVNLLTYSLSGTYRGLTWHNAALLSGGTPYPSADSEVTRFTTAGMPPGKLGIAVTFVPFVWSGGSGVSAPLQTWTSSPTAVATAYFTVAEDYGLIEGRADHPLYRWDAAARAPYLSAASAFVSLEDTFSIQEKFRYARSRGLGSMIVWNMASGWRPGQPPGQRDRLLQEVKAAATADDSLSNPAPTLVGISSSALTLNVSGSGFFPGSVVRWNGSARPTTFLSSGELTAELAAADVETPGTAQVSVFNPVPGGGESGFLPLAISTSVPAAVQPTPGLVDRFGVARLYATAAGGKEWAAKWEAPRSFSNAVDPADPWFDAAHGDASYSAAEGILSISGQTPRMYIHDPALDVRNSWRNVEITVYGRRVADANVPYAGLSSVARTNHGITGDEAVDLCDSRGMGGRIRYDGWTDLAKETSHPNWVQVSSRPHFSGGMPFEQWIGYKHVVYDLPGGGVKQELYYDGSDGAGGGSWLKVNEWEDTGANFGVGGVACAPGVDPALPLTSSDARPGTESGKPNITVYLRSDGVGPSGLLFKKLSVREIEPVPASTAPLAAGLSPSSAAAGGPAFTLAVDGFNFLSTSTVLWNGAPLPTTFVSAMRLLAEVEQALVASSGTAAVSVSGAANALAFPIVALNPAPAVATLSPSSRTAGGGAFTLQVLGSGFVSTSTVLWNGAARATSFVSSAALSAQILAGDAAAPGTAQVRVFNAQPGGGLSNASPFTLAAAPVSTVTLFTTQIPASNAYYIDPSPLEVGVRFRSDVAGQVRGIRFYKVPGNNGTHVGHLWTNTGALLGSASFTGETGTGWQTAMFAAPISIQPNTLYVASYKTPTGYAVTLNYFATAGLDRAPLHAPQSAPGSLNGVYAYGAAPAVFPAQSTRASNYWVDVVFSPAPEPAAAALQPASVEAGASGFTLEVRGSGFTPASTVLWNGSRRQTSFVAPDLLAARIDAADVSAAGTALVTAATPDSEGGLSVANSSFTVEAPQAAKPGAANGPLRVFPNPWRAGLHGGRPIVFDSLAPGSEVRLFTLSGRWIRTLAAPEGKAVWDTTGLSGAGYYLYSATDRRNRRVTGTVAVIR